MLRCEFDLKLVYWWEILKDTKQMERYVHGSEDSVKLLAVL